MSRPNADCRQVATSVLVQSAAVAGGKARYNYADSSIHITHPGSSVKPSLDEMNGTRHGVLVTE